MNYGIGKLILIGGRFLRENKIKTAENWQIKMDKEINDWNTCNPNNIVFDSLYIASGEGSGTTVMTITEGNATNKETFCANPTEGQRSLTDANAIRNYNGGRYYLVTNEYEFSPQNKTNDIISKRRTLQRDNNLTPPFNYVRKVCEEKD